MSKLLDDQYINMISNTLRNFKRVGNHKYLFSCPICGDSEKNPKKARGNIFPSKKSDALTYFCHNCGASHSVSNFLRTINPAVHELYVADKIKENFNQPLANFSSFPSANLPPSKPTIPKRNTTLKIQDLENLNSIIPVAKSTVATQYLTQRHINLTPHLYFTSNWSSLTGEVANKLSKVKDSRIVIPYTTREGIVANLQGRTINQQNGIRYITQQVTPVDEFVAFKYSAIDTDKAIFVYEGAMDATFVPNAIGCGSSTVLKSFCEVPTKGNKIFVFDNEPRNTQILDMIECIIDRGEFVVLLPQTIPKDLNECISQGYSFTDMMEIYKNFVFKGLKAKVEFIKWKKR